MSNEMNIKVLFIMHIMIKQKHSTLTRNRLFICTVIYEVAKGRAGAPCLRVLPYTPPTFLYVVPV